MCSNLQKWWPSSNTNWHQWTWSFLAGWRMIFDGTSKRFKCYKTLVWWVFHPAVRILCLETMEVKSECTREIAKLCNQYNGILSELCGKEGYKFNPKAFLFNEAGADFASIKEEFGDKLFAQRMFTCQWHFRRLAQWKVNAVGEDYQDCLQLCHHLCTAVIAAHYNVFKSRIDIEKSFLV